MMLVAILVFACGVLFADSIELKNGDKITGKIIEQTAGGPGHGHGGIDRAKIQKRIQELESQGKNWDEIRKIIKKEFGVDIPEGHGK